MMIIFSPNRSAPARARATMSCDFPFWRGALTPTNFDAQRPSERSPIAASSACSCHSSSGIPRLADRSATSSQELARALGATRTRGGAGPSSSTPRGDLVDAVTDGLLRAQLVNLGERRPILGNEGGLAVRRRLLEPPEQVLTELRQVVQSSHRRTP